PKSRQWRSLVPQSAEKNFFLSVTYLTLLNRFLNDPSGEGGRIGRSSGEDGRIGRSSGECRFNRHLRIRSDPRRTEKISMMRLDHARIETDDRVHRSTANWRHPFRKQSIHN